MNKFGIGQPVKRFEDRRLLSGEGRFINDVNLAGQSHAVMVRSPHAHARINSINTSMAQAAPGVLGVFTGDDVVADGLGTMKPAVQRKRPDGSPMFARSHPGLATGYVRYVGDPFALVVAATRAQALDAAELIEADFDELPSVTDTAQAAAGRTAVWDECPDNVSNIFEAGDATATDAAFANAARVVHRRYVISRVYAHFMEPRGVIGNYDSGEDRYTLYADVQYPHRVRNALASRIFKIPENKIRVIAGDVGGGFGTKGWQYPEHRLMLWASRKLGRPVKWTCERQEAILADEHARDNISDAELALDADNRILGLRVRTLANVGAYVSSDRNLLATFTNVSTLVGVYDIPAAHVHVSCVMANTSAPRRTVARAGRKPFMLSSACWTMRRGNWALIASHCAVETSFPKAPCLTAMPSAISTTADSSARTWNAPWPWRITMASRFAARKPRLGASCWASALPTPSRRRHRLAWNSPRYASIPAAVR